MTIRMVRQSIVNIDAAAKSLKPFKESIILFDRKIKNSIITEIAKSSGVFKNSFVFVKNLIMPFHMRFSSPADIISNPTGCVNV